MQMKLKIQQLPATDIQRTDFHCVTTCLNSKKLVSRKQ